MRLTSQIICIGLLMFLGYSYANSSPPSLPMVARTGIAASAFTLNAQSQQWLEQHKTLRVGIWGPSRPPIFMGLENKSFQGIAADYLAMIQLSLKVDFKIFYYPELADAQLALKKNQIDIIGFNPVNVQDAELSVTQPFISDRSVLVQRKNRNNSADKELHSLLYIDEIDSSRLLHSAYPEITVTKASVYLNALSNIAYGKADALWMNAATASVLINQGFSEILETVPSKVLPDRSMNFAVRKSDEPLRKAFDEVMDNISRSSRAQVAWQWGLNNRFTRLASEIAFTPEEEAWRNQHPVIDVVLSAAFPPFSYIDKNNIMAGSAVNLLGSISQLTGLKFRYIPTSNYREMLNWVAESSEPVLLGAAIAAQPEDSRFIFSQPYSISPWVLVSKKNKPYGSLAELSGERVVFPLSSGSVEALRERWPDVTIDTYTSNGPPVDQLTNNSVSAVIVPKPLADYFSQLPLDEPIIISGAVDVPSMRLSFASRPDNAILIDMINRAINEIPPERVWRNQMEILAAQHQSRANSWNTFSYYLYRVIAVAAFILIIFIIRQWFLNRDLKLHRRYEKQLIDQLRFTRTLIDKMPVAIFVRDRDTRMLECNDSYLKFLNISSAENIIGKTISEHALLMDNDISSLEALYSEVIQQQKPHYSTRNIVAHGKNYMLYLWVIPYEDSQGEIIGIIGGFIDVTEREMLVNRLQEAKETADLANQSKSVFLSQMSHEIRTPLNALIGLLELEAKGKVAPDKREQNIQVAYEASKSLLSLVGDILDLAKIEAGAQKKRDVPVSLTSIIHSISSLFMQVASKKNLQLITTLEIEHDNVLLDPLMLKQLISNLLSNAIKFTDYGQVEVGLYESQQDGNCVNYLLEVSDSGIGMSDKQQQSVFEPFVQVEEGKRQHEGSGLGLSICRELAERIGAQLNVESVKGEGTTFLLRFSAEICEPLPEQLYDENYGLPASSAKSILIVDDHAPNRLLLSQQLEYAGYRVRGVESGEQALMAWHQQLPDVVITDCNMPGMDGFTLISLLREDEKRNQLAPRMMFGLTAMAEQDVTIRGQQVGMNKCLFKPIELDKLLSYIGSQPPEISSKAGEAVILTLEKLSRSNPAAYNDLIQTLIEDNRVDVENLNTHFRQGDFAALAQSAHRLVGSARMVDANELAETAKALEDAAKDENQTVAAGLIEECSALVEALEIFYLL